MVSRRTVLGGAAGAAFGLTFGSVTAAGAASTLQRPAVGVQTRRGDLSTMAAAKPGDVPRTLAASRALRQGHLRVPEATFPLTHLGVRWQGASPVDVRVRTGAGWTRWTIGPGCDGQPDETAQDGHSALLVVPGALGYEVTTAATAAATVTELNTVDGPALAVAAAAPANGMPLPDGTVCPVPYLSRAAWGVDESDTTEPWPAEFFPVQALTVHHTAGLNNDPNPAGTVRAIYHYQAVTQNWGDIGYNLLIDEAGRVYEGRASGLSRPVYGPTGPDGRPAAVVGGHAQTFNTGNIGVCLLGHFNGEQPTAAARESLIAVLASLARLAGLDVRATVAYVNPENGKTRTVRGISGHRDWAATECPGELFYPTLGAVREAVASRNFAITLRGDLRSIQKPPSKPE